MRTIAIGIRLHQLILSHLCRDDMLIISNTTTWHDLNMDSMDMLEMIITIEDAFDITIENAHNIINFGELVKIVEDRVNREKY